MLSNLCTIDYIRVLLIYTTLVVTNQSHCTNVFKATVGGHNVY